MKHGHPAGETKRRGPVGRTHVQVMTSCASVLAKPRDQETSQLILKADLGDTLTYKKELLEMLSILFHGFKWSGAYLEETGGYGFCLMEQIVTENLTGPQSL